MGGEGGGGGGGVRTLNLRLESTYINCENKTNHENQTFSSNVNGILFCAEGLTLIITRYRSTATIITNNSFIHNAIPPPDFFVVFLSGAESVCLGAGFALK